MPGSTKIYRSNIGYEPNNEIDVSGRFVPTVDLTHYDDDTNSHMSDLPQQLLACANVSANNSALATFSQAGDDSTQYVHSLKPIPNLTGCVKENDGGGWQLFFRILEQLGGEKVSRPSCRARIARSLSTLTRVACMPCGALLRSRARFNRACVRQLRRPLSTTAMLVQILQADHWSRALHAADSASCISHCTCCIKYFCIGNALTS